MNFLNKNFQNIIKEKADKKLNDKFSEMVIKIKELILKMNQKK